MRNVKVEVTDDEIIVRIDRRGKMEQSTSGKSLILATTGGNVPVPGTSLKLGLNVYEPK